MSTLKQFVKILHLIAFRAIAIFDFFPLKESHISLGQRNDRTPAAGAKRGPPSVCHAVHPGPLQLATVWNPNQRSCRTRRLRTGSQGSGSGSGKTRKKVSQSKIL